MAHEPPFLEGAGLGALQGRGLWKDPSANQQEVGACLSIPLPIVGAPGRQAPPSLCPRGSWWCRLRPGSVSARPPSGPRPGRRGLTLAPASRLPATHPAKGRGQAAAGTCSASRSRVPPSGHPQVWAGVGPPPPREPALQARGPGISPAWLPVRPPCRQKDPPTMQ